jgi:hypothetical protein
MFQQSYYLAGPLPEKAGSAAGVEIRCVMPVKVQLLHVSVCAGRAGDAVYRIGTPEDRERYCAAKKLVGGGVVDREGFAGEQYPVLLGGSELVFELKSVPPKKKKKGAEPAGASLPVEIEPAEDVTIVLTFLS